MARLGRYFVPGCPLHVIQRGNNRAPIFFAEADRTFFLDCLGRAAAENGVALHGYVLMTNHLHLLATPRDERSLPRTLQSLGRRYVARINAAQGRTGTLWEGRYRATVIESEAYLLACLRYIEMNPVRAAMVSHPKHHPWSSCRHHLGLAADPLVTEHELFLALGAVPAQRARAWLGLLRQALDGGFVDEIRRATNSGWALGGEAVCERIAAAGRRSAKLQPGRKRKAAGMGDPDPGMGVSDPN